MKKLSKDKPTTFHPNIQDVSRCYNSFLKEKGELTIL